MEFEIRFRPDEGAVWTEHHKLIQVEQGADGEPVAADNEWTLEQRVLRVEGGRRRIAWARRDLSDRSELRDPETSTGEIWVDELGRTSSDGVDWTPPTFPLDPMSVGQIWTLEQSALNLPLHFKLEKAEEGRLSLVSYAGYQGPEGEQEVRGATVLCRRTGRVLRSTSVTRVTTPEGASVQTVVEVEAGELTP